MESGRSQAEARLPQTSFGALLLECRLAANLTQEELAARSGLSAHAISMLERGVRRQPRPHTVECLATALRLDPALRQSLVAAAHGPPVAVPPGQDEPPWSRPPQPRAGLPPSTTPFFTGRDADVARLDRHLLVAARVAVHGMAGVGKTQLAAHFLQERAAEYPDGRFWLRCDQESTLVEDLASLAWRLALPERALPQLERQVEGVLRWLREHPRWILVLDNVEPQTEEAVAHWLPGGLPGHVVLTARAPLWPVHLRLDPLTVESARRFLLRRTGQSDADAAGVVAEALGCLPLALEQAATYVQQSGRDLAGYAVLLRTRLVELMAEGRPHDYPRSVARTWQLSLERVAGERPAAALLLRLCAVLAPDDIPIGVLTGGAGALPAELGAALRDDLELDRTVVALRRYSLVDREGDALRVHRLVQAVVRASLEPDQRREAVACAIRLLAACLPPEPDEHPECWVFYGRLAAHAQVVAQLAGDPPAEPRALGRLLAGVGRYLWARGQFGLAQPFHERALAIRRQALGDDDPDVASSFHDSGWLLRERGEMAAAHDRITRAVAIWERTLGPDHPSTATGLNSLANLLMDMHAHGLSELVDAKPLHERALAVRERVLGPDHPATVESLGNLAHLLMYLGELDSARALFDRALALSEQVLGPDHPNTAARLLGLAILLRKQGDLSGAREIAGHALAVQERVLGPEHPRTAWSLLNLAALRACQGERAVVRPLGERAMATLERTLRPEHAWVIEGRRLLEGLTAE